jgi:hypothetical protein
VSNTGGWQSWGSVTTNLSSTATGVHTVFITFTGPGGDFVNLNWFQFAHSARSPALDPSAPGRRVPLGRDALDHSRPLG